MSMNYLNRLALFLLLCLICSCNKTNHESVVSFMYDQEVKIPSGLYCWNNGEIAQNIINTDSIDEPKIIVWLDSLGCTPCKLRSLFDKEEDYHYLKDTLGISIPYIVVLSPPSGEIVNTIQYIWECDFDYPILFDFKSDFLVQNSFIPSDQIYHTFLVDTDNNIKVVGPPFFNSKMLDLYLNTIKELDIKNNDNNETI